MERADRVVDGETEDGAGARVEGEAAGFGDAVDGFEILDVRGR